MNKDDFIFAKMNPEFKDWYFTVTGETRKELTSKYMEQSLVCIEGVIYSEIDDVILIQKLFPFNFRYDIVENEELKSFVISIINDMKKEES